MGKFLKIALLTVTVLMFGGEVACAGQSADLVKTGRGKDGSYVIPASLAVECDVAMSDSSASFKMEECFKRLIKERATGGEKSLEIEGIWNNALNESDLGSLVEALEKKVYASDYDKDIMDGFQDNMSGKGLSTSEAGGVKATQVREDALNTAQSDRHIAEYANGELNSLMATIIMRRALRALSGMDTTYLEE